MSSKRLDETNGLIVPTIMIVAGLIQLAIGRALWPKRTAS